MKELGYYKQLNYRLEVKKDSEGGYVLSYPDLKGCITCAPDLTSGLELIDDAQTAWLEAAIEDGLEIPEPKDTAEYSGQFKLRLPKSLHRELSERAQEEGISMNQYCLYLLSKNIGSGNAHERQ